MTLLRRPLLTVLLAIALFAPLVVACGGDDDDDAASESAPLASPTAATTSSTATMDHSMMASPGEESDPDLAFLDAMIIHHGSAVMMAELAQEAAEHEEIKQLAGAIIVAQTEEIEQLEVWRGEWHPDAPESDLSGMMGMAGMNMSEADMQMLRDADDFDRMFIEMMIPHHESAIEMARALQETTERPELQELTEAIIEAQQAEIEQMRQWLDEWYGAS